MKREIEIETVLSECPVVSLSRRAWNVLAREGVQTVKDFLEIPTAKYREFRNSGVKTEREFCDCRVALLRWRNEPEEAGDCAPEEPTVEGEEAPEPEATPVDLPDDAMFQAMVAVWLPERAKNYLSEHGIDTAQAFMELQPRSLMDARAIGKKTIAEVEALQRALRTGKRLGNDLLPDWEDEPSWDSLFGHLLAVALKGKPSPLWEIVARKRLGLEPGLIRIEILEEVAVRLAVTRSRAQQIEPKVRDKLQQLLSLHSEMVERAAEALKAFLDCPGEGARRLEEVAADLRGRGYAWLGEGQEGALLPLMRLIRLWNPKLPLGWGVDAKGQVWVWWDLCSAFGEAWARLEAFVRERMDVKEGENSAKRIQKWRIEQEKMPEWQNIRFLVELFGKEKEDSATLPKRKKGSSESCVHEAAVSLPYETKEAKKAFVGMVRRIEVQLNKKDSTTHREHAILEALRAGGAMTIEQLAEGTGISFSLVRSSLFALDRNREVQMAGKSRFCLPIRLEAGLVHEVEAFLREQFERGGVDCGFIYQAYEHFKARLPETCDDEAVFYGALRLDERFRLCLPVYPGVATRDDLRTRDGANYDGPFWVHLRQRLACELPVSAERVREIWTSWFGGNETLMHEKLTNAFGLCSYERGKERWYDRDWTREREGQQTFSEEELVAAKAFEAAIGKQPFNFTLDTACTLLEKQVGRRLTLAVLQALRARMFMRKDGLWFTLASVCPEEEQEALAQQCVAWLETYPFVALERLGQDLPECPAWRRGKKSKEDRAAFLARVVQRYAQGLVKVVYADHFIRPNDTVHQAELKMAELVTDAVEEAGGEMAVAALLECFPALDETWLRKRWVEMCKEEERASLVEDGYARTVLEADGAAVRPFVEDALSGQSREVLLDNLLVDVAARSGEREVEDFLGAYFLGNRALFKCFVALSEAANGRKWRGEVLGAQKLTRQELASELGQPFTTEEFLAAGRRRCGWKKDEGSGDVARLWAFCLRLDNATWMLPEAFREQTGWDGGLAGQVEACLRDFLGHEPYFAFACITQGQLDALPELGEHYRWTPELAESVAALLLPNLRVLDHARDGQVGSISGFLVPDEVDAKMDGIVYLTQVYRNRYPRTATVEGALDLIVDGVRVRTIRSAKLRRQVESLLQQQ